MSDDIEIKCTPTKHAVLRFGVGWQFMLGCLFHFLKFIFCILAQRVCIWIFYTGKDTDGNELTGWERGLSCVSLVPAAKWAKFGKYADEALVFAGKLDDKLARTRLGESIQTAKRKLEDRFSRGKETACGCNDFLTPKGKSKLVKFKNQMLLEQHFDKHAKKIMKAMGKNQYTIKEYLEDANHVIRNGQYVPELNAYVKLIGGKGKAKYAFVGMDRKTGNITTFHIKSAKELSKEAPSLGIEYK